MLKRKVLAVTLPLLAGVAIVGSGFAAWHFEEANLQNKNVGIGVNITDEVKISGTKIQLEYSTLSAPDSYKELPTAAKTRVVLDQGKREKVGLDTTGLSDINTGISFEIDADGAGVTNTWETLHSIRAYIIEETEGQIQKLYNAGYKINFNYEVKFDATLMKYVQTKSTSNWATNGQLNGQTGTFTGSADIKAEKVDGNKFIINGQTGAFTLKFNSEKTTSNGHDYLSNNSVLQYYADTKGDEHFKKPSTSAEYTKMVETLKPLTGESATNAVSIKFNASLIDNDFNQKQ